MASDDDGEYGVLDPQDNRNAKDKAKDKRRITLAALLQRECRCTAGNCLRQFDNGKDKETITNIRFMFNALNEADLDLPIHCS